MYGIIALLGINIIITIHEAGHYGACKIFDIETPEFSIGFGPIIASYTYDTTQFSLRALPLGGYVQIAGMDGAEEEANTFADRPYYQQAIVILAGIIMNIMLGMIVFNIISPREFSYRLRNEIGVNRGIIGPIGIVSILMQTAASGWDMYWGFIGLLSVNLAVINAIPLPFLDGGQFVSYTMQAINETFNLTEMQQAWILAALFFIIMYIIYSLLSRNKQQ